MRRWCEEGRESERENRRKVRAIYNDNMVRIAPHTAHMQTLGKFLSNHVAVKKQIEM